MTGDTGSGAVEGLTAEILRFAQDDGDSYGCSVRLSRVYSIRRSSVCSVRQYPVHSTRRSAVCTVPALVSSRRIQQTPYKPLEGWRLRAGVWENAYRRETPIKMSVLARVGGSSFHW
jgi:hypothetical protein